MNLKKNKFLFLVLSCIVFFSPLTAKAKTNLFNSNFLLAFQKNNNTQKTNSNTNRSQVSEQVKIFRFPPLGSSRRVTTGATRTDRDILKVLVPSTTNEQNSQSEFYIYSTYAQYPTFIIYFNNPQITPRNTTVKFTLNNLDNTQFYETYFEVKNSGIYFFQLPKNQQGLSVNNNYLWQFSLVYGEQNQYTWLSDQGLIQRQSISEEINQQLQQTSEPEKVIIYGKNQIWHDTLSYLTNLYCWDNYGYRESWKNLLDNNNISLEKLENQDLLSCYESKEELEVRD